MEEKFKKLTGYEITIKRWEDKYGHWKLETCMKELMK